jgi:dihydroflavonol-4-reductase
MRVLITGATDLLGGHLLDALIQHNEQIRALVLPVEPIEKLLGQGVEVIRGDVTDSSTLASAVKDIDIVIHLAGVRKI